MLIIGKTLLIEKEKENQDEICDQTQEYRIQFYGSSKSICFFHVYGGERKEGGIYLKKERQADRHYNGPFSFIFKCNCAYVFGLADNRQKQFQTTTFSNPQINLLDKLTYIRRT